jgi:hypothetical protein
MSDELRTAMIALWPAAVVAATFMLAAWWPRWRRKSATGAVSTGGEAGAARRGWVGALAFGLAFIASFLVIAVRKSTQLFSEQWHWLACIDVAAMLVGMLASARVWPAGARVMLGLIAAALAGGLLHPPASIEHPQAFRAACAAASFIIWLAMESTARRHRGFSTPLLLALMFAGLSMVILHGHSAVFSLLAASLAAALTGAAVVGMLVPLSLANGATHVLAAMLAATIATAWMYQTGERAALIVLLAAPLLLGAADALTSDSLAWWKRFALRLTCVLVPVAIAVAIAMRAAASADAGYP